MKRKRVREGGRKKEIKRKRAREGRTTGEQ
jgi:hypothetical protein